MKINRLLLLVSSTFILLSACGEKENSIDDSSVIESIESTSSTSENTHSHNFVIREYDDHYHWMKCEGCDDISSKEEHNLSSWEYVARNEDNTFVKECSICDYELVNKDVPYQVTVNDSNSHTYGEELDISKVTLTVSIDNITKTYSNNEIDIDTSETNMWDISMKSSYKVSLKDNPLICSKYEFDLAVRNNLKVLFIGNSFSEDTVTYLPRVSKSLGINIELHHAYIGGCSIDQHYSYLTSNTAKYIYSHYNYTKMAWEWDGSSSEGSNILSNILKKADFDVISIQQVSQESGQADKFSNLNNYISAIKAKLNNPNKVQFIYNMTWAYPNDSDSPNFAIYHRNQMEMYTSIVSTTKEKILPNENIKAIIPNGTMLQNARTSYIEDHDNFHRDALHLNTTFGRYFASLTAVKTLTGVALENITYKVCNEFYKAIGIESVNNAVAKPFEVTPSIYKEMPEEYRYLEVFNSENSTGVNMTFNGNTVSKMTVTFANMAFGTFGSHDGLNKKYFGQLKSLGYESISYDAKITEGDGNLAVTYLDEAGKSVQSYLNKKSATGTIMLDKISELLCFWCYQPNTGVDAVIEVKFTCVKGDAESLFDPFSSSGTVYKYFEIGCANSSTPWGEGNKIIYCDNLTRIRFTDTFISECEKAGVKSFSFDIQVSDKTSDNTDVFRIVRWDNNNGGSYPQGYQIYNGTSATITVILDDYYSTGTRPLARPAIIFQNSSFNNITVKTATISNYSFNF